MNDLFDRALKGWITSLLGLGLMVYAFFRWDQEMLTDTEAIVIALIGAAFIFIKDKISEYINRVLGGLIDKFLGPKK